MKYKKQLFDYAVKDYKRILKDYQYKSIFIFLDITNQHALFSIAPLSQAIHELHSDTYITTSETEKQILNTLWPVYEEHISRKRGKLTKHLSQFIRTIESKSNKPLEKLFRPPALTIEAGKDSFKAGKLKLPYKYKWFKPYKAPQLDRAVKALLKNSFALKKNEVMEINLPLIPPENILKLPLEDYLDSYAIVWNILKEAERMKAKSVIRSQTDRVSPSEPSEHIADLLLTLYGCEYSKNIKDPVFREYAKFSKIFKLNQLKPPQLRFLIHTQGYRGKHRFGEYIGYPTPDKKSKWTNPKTMFLKLESFPQSQFDNRKPQTRVAMTETLPIDVFIESTSIDYKKMKMTTDKIHAMLQGCLLINVISNETGKENTTNLIIDMAESTILVDDYDLTTIVRPNSSKKIKGQYGNYENVPAGEVFMTPRSMQGTFVGDVAVAIDRSIMLSPKNPLVVEVEDGKYAIKEGPKSVLEKIERTKAEQLKLLEAQEKHNAIPKALALQMKHNFNRIGEFAINTHPTARVCNYLVVNEKIARMIHIALGSGFEKDRKTVYHFDIVINAAKQKLDIYGVKPDGEEVWILRKGRMVVS